MTTRRRPGCRLNSAAAQQAAVIVATDCRMRVLVGYAQHTRPTDIFKRPVRCIRCCARQFLTRFCSTLLPAMQRANFHLCCERSMPSCCSIRTNGDTTIYLQPHVEALARRTVPLLTFRWQRCQSAGSPIADKRRLFAVLNPEFIATQTASRGRQTRLLRPCRWKGWRRDFACPEPCRVSADESREDGPLDVRHRLSVIFRISATSIRNRLLQWFTKRSTPPSRLKCPMRPHRKGWRTTSISARQRLQQRQTIRLERDDATSPHMRLRSFNQTQGRRASQRLRSPGGDSPAIDCAAMKSILRGHRQRRHPA